MGRSDAMTDHPSWAATDSTPQAALENVLERLPVSLIATPRRQLFTCTPSETLGEISQRSPGDFDFYPVTEAAFSGPIIGLLNLTKAHEDGDPGAYVADHFDRLAEQNLIGADASILAFIREADERACRLVIAGREISGLVTTSDLQRLPVRASLFAMITRLEMAMSEAIRRQGSDDEWIALLSEGRRKNLRKKIDASKSSDSFVDSLLYTDFCDKRDILARTAFSGRKKVFLKDLRAVEDLRNSVAHSGHYAATRADAKRLSSTVRSLDYWLGEIHR
jgi:hypothetical protein